MERAISRVVEADAVHAGAAPVADQRHRATKSQAPRPACRAGGERVTEPEAGRPRIIEAHVGSAWDAEVYEVARPLLPLVRRAMRLDQPPVVVVAPAHVLLGDHDVAVVRPDRLDHADVSRGANAEGAAVPFGYRAHRRPVADEHPLRGTGVGPLPPLPQD